MLLFTSHDTITSYQHFQHEHHPHDTITSYQHFQHDHIVSTFSANNHEHHPSPNDEQIDPPNFSPTTNKKLPRPDPPITTMPIDAKKRESKHGLQENKCICRKMATITTTKLHQKSPAKNPVNARTPPKERGERARRKKNIKLIASIARERHFADHARNASSLISRPHELTTTN